VVSFLQLGQPNIVAMKALRLCVYAMFRNCSLSLFAAAAIGLTSSQIASAADLARPLPPAPVYIPPAPIPYIWTGCYVGGNAGGAWSHVEFDNVSTGGNASASNSGVAGGGQVGCDYQTGGWVFGIRNMFDATSRLIQSD
jgi:outer membrane immunogenic protein